MFLVVAGLTTCTQAQTWRCQVSCCPQGQPRPWLCLWRWHWSPVPLAQSHPRLAGQTPWPASTNSTAHSCASASWGPQHRGWGCRRGGTAGEEEPGVGWLHRGSQAPSHGGTAGPVWAGRSHHVLLTPESTGRASGQYQTQLVLAITPR